MVRGFDDYFSKVPNGIVEINVEEELGYAKNPIILIVVPCFVARFTTILSHRPEQFCGGRGQIFLQRTKFFLDRLTKAGAKLVFFLDKFISHKQNVTETISKLNKRNQSERKCIESLLFGISPRQVAERNGFIHIHTNYLAIFSEIVASFGDVEHTTEEERDQLLAQYAEKHKAYAVIADKRESIIFSGIERLWRCETLWVDRGKIKVSEYSGNILRRELGLYPGEEMALWATLAGNSFLDKDITIAFAKKYGGFEGVSEYIRGYRGKNLEQMIPNIAKHVAYVANKNSMVHHITENIRSSVNYYLKKTHDSKLEVLEIQKSDSGLHYSIKYNEFFAFESVMEALGDSHPFAKIAEDIFRRLMGVFLTNENDHSLVRKIVTLNENQKKYEILNVEGIYPQFSVPDYEDLISECEEAKWNILNFVLSANWNRSVFAEVEPKEMAVKITTEFLKNHTDFQQEELDLLLKGFRNPVLNPDLRLPDKLYPRAIQLVFKFMNCYNLMNALLDAIGFKEWSTSLPFDGVYFHYLYNKELA